jgi:uncharacterized repeat protein (TIGR03803 family)
MGNPAECSTSVLGVALRGTTLLALVCALSMLAIHPAQAQTFTVLHNFTGSEGADPTAGLSIDSAGNLYGTASGGGPFEPECSSGCGGVFKLQHNGAGWIFLPLHVFTGAPDGAYPQARVILRPGGLYGTTYGGGDGGCSEIGCGTVFRLTPPAHACGSVFCPWTATVLYAFHGGSDGESPASGDVVFDQAGNIYGTTSSGGSYGSGTVYELSPSGGGWTETVLYSFQGNNDGATPIAGVVFDNAGNLYGTTALGGIHGYGTIYKLTPSPSGWTKNTLYDFPFYGSAGIVPAGGLIFDSSGNLYGATTRGGPYDGGAAYELTPSSDGWTLNALYSFLANDGPFANLATDAAGNLYGTLYGPAIVEVFRLTPSGGQWTLTGFNGSAGNTPQGNVIFDASGNLYTTASQGGTYGLGVVFEVTP